MRCRHPTEMSKYEGMIRFALRGFLYALVLKAYNRHFFVMQELEQVL